MMQNVTACSQNSQTKSTLSSAAAHPLQSSAPTTLSLSTSWCKMLLLVHKTVRLKAHCPVQ